MTALQYLISTKVCTTAELIAFKKEHPADYPALVSMAKEQAANEGVAIEESVNK